MSDHEIQLRDSLGAAHSYLHAIRRITDAAFSNGGEDYCALSLLVDSVQAEITKAQQVVDNLGGK